MGWDIAFSPEAWTQLDAILPLILQNDLVEELDEQLSDGPGAGVRLRTLPYLLEVFLPREPGFHVSVAYRLKRDGLIEITQIWMTELG